MIALLSRTDEWTNRKYRSVKNLCVHYKEETNFIKSIENSTNAHTGEYIFNWVKNCFKKVGEKRVFQVITNNYPSSLKVKIC